MGVFSENYRYQKLVSKLGSEPQNGYQPSFPESDFKGGSGIYTSNPDLEWVAYFEPESTVISRSGDTCVVAETDQWYINYADEKWVSDVKSYVENHLECFDPAVKRMLIDTIDASHPWPVSRTFGMGTKLPFDEK